MEQGFAGNTETATVATHVGVSLPTFTCRGSTDQ
jgi:hypothetical protein